MTINTNTQKGPREREFEKWGDLGTMDFLHFNKAWHRSSSTKEESEAYVKGMKHEKEATGVGRRNMALLYADAFTGHLYGLCCSQRTEDNVEWALVVNAGRQPIRHVYSDAAKEFRTTSVQCQA